MNKSYTPEEAAKMVLKKALDLVTEALQKARIDEGMPISNKIEARTQRNERQAKNVTLPHPQDKRLGTDELQTNFVGKPKKPQKLKDFLTKMDEKRSKK